MKLKLLIPIIVMFLLVPALALADTLVLQIADTENLQDVRVDEGAPTTNYNDVLVLYEFSSVGKAQRIYITFNLNATELIGVTITSANLSIYVNTVSIASKTINIHEVNSSVNSWDETTLTWNTQPCGTAFDNALVCNLIAETSQPQPTSANQWFNISVTEMVGKYLALGGGNVSMMLKFETESDGNGGVYARAKEHATASERPKLIIGYELSDTTPPTVTVTSPTNNTGINIIPFNFSVTVTDDTNDILCILSNSSDVFDTETTAGGDINLTFEPAITDIQQRAIFNITCYDNDADNNNSRFILFNLTLDNILPAITLTLPLNNTRIDKTFDNLTIESSCSDPHAIAFNYSLIDIDGIIVNSSQNTTVSTNIVLNRIIDLTNIDPGAYNINFTCVDGHTYTDSKIKYYLTDDVYNKVYYGTDSGNDISISLDYADLNLCSYGSRSEFDREVFWYDFRCNLAPKSTYTYRFILRDNEGQLRYLKDSGYDAHFVTKDNFITFQIDNDASYTVMKSGKDYIITLKTTETFLDFSNSIGGLNKFQEFLNINIIETNFTALEQFSVTLDDIIFDSSTPLRIANLTFNLSEDRLLIIRSSLTVEKFNLPQESIVSATFTFNGLVVFNGTLRTVSTAGDVGSVTFIPMTAKGLSGENSLEIDVSDTGAGGINISTWDISINTNMTSGGNQINILRENRTITFSSISFTNITSFTFNRDFNSSAYINIHHILSAEGSTTVQCSINRTTSSPFYERLISSSTDIGSSGISWIDEFNSIGLTPYNLSCKNDNANTVTSKITILAYELTDAGDDIIQSNQSTNPSTDIENTVSFGAGIHELTSLKNIDIMAGDSLEIISTAIISSSSGSQTPRIFITSSKDSCTNSHRRTLSDNNDIATVKFYTNCNATVSESIDITLNVEVEAGETLILRDESLSIFETIQLNLSFENVAPLVVTLFPAPGKNLFDVNAVTWLTIDENKNTFTTNITATNISDSTDITQIATDIADDIFSASFNFTLLGEGSFILNITSTENTSGERLFGTSLTSFNVVFPSISVNLTTPLNNSIDIDGLVVFNFVTDTGGVNNCSLFIDNTINFVNQSLFASVGKNTFQPVRLANGTHTWLVRCDNVSLTGVSSQFNLNVEIPDPNALSILTCPTTTAGVFMIALIIFISLAFITLGMIFNIGIVGFFGAILLMISTWFISPCSNIFAYALALLSAVLLFFFVIRGFFPHFSMLTGKP